MDTDIINARNFFEDPFISQIDKFGENVITSIRLRDNYHKIDKIRVLICNKSGLKIELSNDSNLTLEAFMEDNFPEEKKYEFVEHIANYFSNQMKRILKDVKQNKSVFNYSYRRANWVLIVIAKFLEINNIDNEIENFHISDFCEKAEDATDVNSILTKAYQAEVFRKNINSLGLSLVYYITKVYPIIFNISKNNIEIKKEYQEYKTKKTLIEFIHDFKRIKTKQKRMQSEKFEKVNVENEIYEIAKTVFSKYII